MLLVSPCLRNILKVELVRFFKKLLYNYKIIRCHIPVDCDFIISNPVHSSCPCAEDHVISSGSHCFVSNDSESKQIRNALLTTLVNCEKKRKYDVTCFILHY